MVSPPGLLFVARAAIQSTAELVPSFTGARRVSVMLEHHPEIPDRNEMYLAAGVGLPISAGRWVRVGPGILAEARRRREPILVPDLLASPFAANPERGYATRACMAAPVEWEGLLFGVVCAADPEGREGFPQSGFANLHHVASLLATVLYCVASASLGPHVDPMTGLQTRQAFDERLATEVERSDRFGRPLSLVVLDIDHLGRLNDRSGRLIGDRALCSVARAMLGAVRQVDLVARYGGDEFVVLLPETPAHSALVVAERIAECLAGHALPGNSGDAIPVRVSIGAATLGSSDGPAELIQGAYRALDQAKRDRGGVRHCDPAAGGPRLDAPTSTCRTCGARFPVPNTSAARSRRYCSRGCAAAGRREPTWQRNQEIIGMWRAGWSVLDVAARFGITEERVRQICRGD